MEPDVQMARHLIETSRTARVVIAFTGHIEMPLDFRNSTAKLRYAALHWVLQEMQARGTSIIPVRCIAGHAHTSVFVMISKYLAASKLEPDCYPHLSQLLGTIIDSDLAFTMKMDPAVVTASDKYHRQWMLRVDALSIGNPFDDNAVELIRSAPAYPHVVYTPCAGTLYALMTQVCDETGLSYLDAVDAAKVFYAIPCMWFDPHGVVKSFTKKAAKARKPNMTLVDKFLGFVAAADIEEFSAISGQRPQIEAVPGYEWANRPWGQAMLAGRRFSIPEEEWGFAWLSEVEDLEWDCIERPLDAKDVSSMPPLG
eukprot:1661064-Amphidinium_carterae.1